MSRKNYKAKGDEGDPPDKLEPTERDDIESSDDPAPIDEDEVEPA